MTLTQRVILLLGFASLSVAANAQTVDAYDRGWYSSTSGVINAVPGNLNYLVGLGLTATPNVLGRYKDYFAFDLTSYAGKSFSSATLHLYNPQAGDLNGSPTFGGFFQFSQNPQPYETFEVHEVTTSPASLLGGTAGLAGYTDLGDGPVFGSYNATLADNGHFIDVTLNASGLTALNAAAGGIFIVGGVVTTIDTPGFGTQTIFGFSNQNRLSDTQLILTAAIPEPETYAMLLAGLGLLGWVGKRRKQQTA